MKNLYVDFYDNIYRLHKKNIYIRKYHILNVLEKISLDNEKLIPNRLKNHALKSFECLNAKITEILDLRKRPISVKYLIFKLLELWGIDKYPTKITKSNHTLKEYDDIWDKIIKLVDSSRKRVNHYLPIFKIS